MTVLDGRSTERSTPLLREQRKSARFAAALGVQLTYGGVRELVRTTDVSFHGLFVAMERPPPARMMVELTIYLPEGPLRASAFVARHIARSASVVPGAGLQLFAVGASAKARWDLFLRTLGDERDATDHDDHHVPRDPDRPTFLLKVRDEARLRELFERNVRTGEVYLATPVIKEPGTEVALIVIHPRTEAEVLLVGRVDRVRRERPKGMEIHLQPPLSAGGLARFAHFVETGIAPELPPAPSEPEPGAKSFELTIEEPVPYSSEEDFDWSDVSESLVIDFELQDVTPVAEQLELDDDFVLEPEIRDLGDARAEARAIERPEELVPIAIDPSALEADANDPSANDPSANDPSAPRADELDLHLAIARARAPTSEGPPISIDLDGALDEPADPPSISVDLDEPPSISVDLAAAAQPLAIVVGTPTSGGPFDGPTSDLGPGDEDGAETRGRVELPDDHPLYEPLIRARVRCTHCAAKPFVIELGSPAGPLGLLARRRPFYCERCDAFVSVLRMKPIDERRRVREAIWLADSRALEAKVTIELLFEVAALANSTARCTICGGAGRTTTTTEALEAATSRLELNETVPLPRASCVECGEKALVAERTSD